MSAKCSLFLLALLLFPVMASMSGCSQQSTVASAVSAKPSRAGGAAFRLTVAHISRGEQVKTSAPDVIERALDGKVLRRGVQDGQKLPDDVQVQVPANVTLVIANGRSTASLQPGSTDTFAWTGARESVTINFGKATFDDPLDFYHVNAGQVVAAHHSTVFSFTVDSKSVTITCTEGVVEATRVGSIGSGRQAVSYVEQVDRISGTGRSSITYTLGQESATDAAVRFQAYQLAAAQGDANAEVNLGRMYEHGEGVAQNYATALHYYQLAAAQGNAVGENNLGFMYMEGHGVARDYAKAVHYYRLAAAHGNAAGESNLGLAYYNGHGVPQDFAEAMRYDRLAAAQGDAFGETSLGMMYYVGEGVSPDNAIAVHYYQLAAGQGDAGGEDGLGYMYASGKAVPQDYVKAVHYYRLAGAQGFSYGDFHLAIMYEHGWGVSRDYREAARYYKIAAALGNDYAENSLGYAYEHGQGVPKSYATALHYYQLAVAQGYADAAAAVTRLSRLLKQRP